MLKVRFVEPMVYSSAGHAMFMCEDPETLGTFCKAVPMFNVLGMARSKTSLRDLLKTQLEAQFDQPVELVDLGDWDNTEVPKRDPFKEVKD